MEECWPLNEYEKLVIWMNNNPSVVIDNAVSPTATLVKVDSGREHGVLLEAIQVLADLDISITKAYISSDGRWFMDVFHVTDAGGRKLDDDGVISYIQRSLAAVSASSAAAGSPADEAAAGCSGFGRPPAGATVLEIAGVDRPGLLSEVFAVLADLQCGVTDAKVWTNNGRIASLVFLRDEEAGGADIAADSHKAGLIQSRLRHLVGGRQGSRGAAAISALRVHAERRLHQLMFEDRDYEPAALSGAGGSPSVSVQNCAERCYSVVSVQSRDRPKLLFDTVCALTDMGYVVFHGTVDTYGDGAHQEFFIRHKDGTPISSEAERRRVMLCLQAAVERRSSEGLRLELCGEDRQGLLADVTRTFRENGLLVARADVSTKDQMAADVFYVTGDGDPAGLRAVADDVRSRIGDGMILTVLPDDPPWPAHRRNGAGEDDDKPPGIFNLVFRNLYNLGLTWS